MLLDVTKNIVDTNFVFILSKLRTDYAVGAMSTVMLQYLSLNIYALLIRQNQARQKRG